MTNANTKEVKDIFSNFTIKKFKVYRRNSGKTPNELIILSNNL